VRCLLCFQIRRPDESRISRTTSAASTAAAFEAEKDLPQSALYQKVILLCILVYLLAKSRPFVLPPPLRAYSLVVPRTGPDCGERVFICLLHSESNNIGICILLGILTLIPLVGLIGLLIITAKRQAYPLSGSPFGLLGARLSQFDEVRSEGVDVGVDPNHIRLPVTSNKNPLDCASFHLRPRDSTP